MVDVTPQIAGSVARMREKISAGKAKSEVLKLRLANLGEIEPSEKREMRVGHVSAFNHDLSNERINALLATLFNHPSSDPKVAYQEPRIPQGIPLEGGLKDKATVV